MGINTKTIGKPGKIDRKAKGLFLIEFNDNQISDQPIKLAGRIGDSAAILSGGGPSSYVDVKIDVRWSFESEFWSVAGANPRLQLLETYPGANNQLITEPMVEGCSDTQILTYQNLRGGSFQGWDFGGGTVGYYNSLTREDSPTVSTVCLSQRSGTFLVKFSNDVNPNEVIIRPERAAYYDCTVKRL